YKYTLHSDIYSLSLHDALPICILAEAKKREEEALKRVNEEKKKREVAQQQAKKEEKNVEKVNENKEKTEKKEDKPQLASRGGGRSEEHTSELQSRFDLVCRLLL